MIPSAILHSRFYAYSRMCFWNVAVTRSRRLLYDDFVKDVAWTLRKTYGIITL